MKKLSISLSWLKRFFADFPVKIGRIANIFAHRYLVFFIVSFILSYELVFKDLKCICEFRFIEAVAILLVLGILFGKRGRSQAVSLDLGFVLCWLYFQYGINQFSIVPWIVLVLLLVFGVCTCLVKKTDEFSKMMKVSDLYAGRIKVFRKISGYLSNHSVLAIDSPYGNGKSTMVEALRNQNREWRFLTFGVLSTTVENVEFCIVREIDRLLESEGIYSNPISKIKSFFSHDFAYCIGELLFENPSYEDQIKDFVADIRKLGKVVVLNFEDVDRITDKEHLNKVFSICDTLLKYEVKEKEKYIKVIYQCNIKTLQELFENEKYIEKYIPYAISLDVLDGNFFNRVRDKNIKKYNRIASLDFAFLTARPMSIMANQELPLLIDTHTVRSVEQALDKINFTFENDDRFSIDNVDDVRAVVIFFITRYFFKDLYNSLDKNKKMVQQRVLYHNRVYDKGNVESLENMWKYVNKNASSEERSNPAFSETIQNYMKPFFDEYSNKKAKLNKQFLVIMYFLGLNNQDFNEPLSVNYEREEKFKLLLNEYAC